MPAWCTTSSSPKSSAVSGPPITGSMARANGRQAALRWEPDKGAYVGVMKRNGSAKDLVWFARELLRLPRMNAWEEENRIVADVMQFEEGRCSTTPTARRPTQEIARTAVPLELRSRCQYRPLHANLSRRNDRRISAHRRSPRRAQKPPRLVRLRQS